MRVRVLTRSLSFAALLAVMLAAPVLAQHQDHGYGHAQSRQWQGGAPTGATDTTTIPERSSVAFCLVSASGRYWVELSLRHPRSCTHRRRLTPIHTRHRRRSITATDPPG